MSRERGVEVEVLDYEKLAAACHEYGLAAPSYSGNAILRRRDGAAVVISYEGVANTELREGMVCVTTMFTEWQYLPLEVAEACRTGERVDLADHIRTFGSRLDVNHWHWYQWAEA